MLDILGNELQIGDTVITIHNKYKMLKIGKITSFTKEKIYVDDKIKLGYQVIKYSKNNKLTNSQKEIIKGIFITIKELIDLSYMQNVNKQNRDMIQTSYIDWLIHQEYLNISYENFDELWDMFDLIINNKEL